MLKVVHGKFACSAGVGEFPRQTANSMVINDLWKIGSYMRKVGEVLSV